MITGMGKVLGGGEYCRSPHAALGWWDDIADIIDKELQYQSILIFSLYMLRREILGMSEALRGATTVPDPAVSFAYCLRALAELLSRLMTGWGRKEYEIHVTAEKKRQREKAWGEEGRQISHLGIFETNCPLREVVLGTCYAQLLKTESYFETTSLCYMTVHITCLPCLACISFGGLCCPDVLLSKAHENNVTSYRCQISVNFEISSYLLYKTFYFNLHLMHHMEDMAALLLA